MTRAGEIGRALVGRHWRFVTIMVLALMALLAWLGFWQLDRLSQRRAANAQLLAALESSPIDLNNEISAYADVAAADVAPDLANRDVLMTGSFDFANQRILKLQNWQGQPGVHLITPFLLDGSEVAVLVDRGWIPDAEYQAGNTFDESSGSPTVDGYIALTETISRRTADAVVPVSPGAELFRVDIAAVQEEMPYALAPFFVKQAPLDGVPVSLPVRIPKEVDLSEGPHLSYAIQWFIFSLGLGIGYLFYVNRWLTMQTAPQSGPETARQN
jgi:surfeit locus 1 family protein